MAIISKKEVEHLAELARMEISDVEKEKLAGDLEKILKYFEELKEMDTEDVKSMDSGTSEENVFRADSAAQINADQNADQRRRLMDQLPEEKDGFLKVPPVFNDENLEATCLPAGRENRI